jgi:hypothetical protein
MSARIAFAFVIGAVFVTTAMFFASAVGIPWNGWFLIFTLVLGGGGGFAALRRRVGDATQSTRVPLAILGFAVLTGYGTLTARETCADLLYFWGPKAVRFAAARGIDLAFLRAPDHFLMHPDYPPLLPLLYAWGALVVHGFSYWGPLLLTPILLAFTALILRGTAHCGGALMAAVLAFGYAQGLAAGAADPLLILFEVAALCALTFLDDPLLASIALAGAAMTKVEGAAFVVVVVIAYAIVSRRPLRALAIAIAPALLLGSWIAFARAHGLLDSYARGSTSPTWSFEPVKAVARAASYHAYYLPWLAVLTPLAFAKKLQRATLPLLVAAGSLAYILFFYLHADANLDFWIAVSAERVLLTPLAALAVAAAAASE